MDDELFGTAAAANVRELFCKNFNLTRYQAIVDTANYYNNTEGYIEVRFERVKDPRLRSRFIKLIQKQKDNVGMVGQDIAVAVVPPLRGCRRGVLYYFTFLVNREILIYLSDRYKEGRG